MLLRDKGAMASWRRRARAENGESSSMLAFVYGTLKRGEPNSSWMSDGGNGKAEYVGDGRTATK